MERRDARLFQHDATTQKQGWNIIELESHRQIRHKVNELIELTSTTPTSTAEIQQRLLVYMKMYSNRFAAQLVRSLQCDDEEERQCVVWLLTLLNDENTISPLQQISLNERLPRSIRLSASLALAGMGATKETTEEHRRVRVYARS